MGSKEIFGQNTKYINKNGMIVTWEHQNDRIHFTMEAPTDGWVTIGFNIHDGTKGAYLLMGKVVDGKAQVVEHYTSNPGNYRPITQYGVTTQVNDTRGIETSEKTSISFSLPTKSHSKYQKSLNIGQQYHLIMAYSQEDDFQHHSIMRTSTKIKL